MANFTVRVELHEASDGQYEELHAEMESRGFVRWIEGKNGKKKLPTAEYNLVNSALTRDEVLAKAEAAADAVKPSPKPWILVTDSRGRSWSGLKNW